MSNEPDDDEEEFDIAELQGQTNKPKQRRNLPAGSTSNRPPISGNPRMVFIILGVIAALMLVIVGLFLFLRYVLPPPT